MSCCSSCAQDKMYGSGFFDGLIRGMASLLDRPGYSGGSRFSNQIINPNMIGGESYVGMRERNFSGGEYRITDPSFVERERRLTPWFSNALRGGAMSPAKQYFIDGLVDYAIKNGRFDELKRLPIEKMMTLSDKDFIEGLKKLLPDGLDEFGRPSYFWWRIFDILKSRYYGENYLRDPNFNYQEPPVKEFVVGDDARYLCSGDSACEKFLGESTVLDGDINEAKESIRQLIEARPLSEEQRKADAELVKAVDKRADCAAEMVDLNIANKERLKQMICKEIQNVELCKEIIDSIPNSWFLFDGKKFADSLRDMFRKILGMPQRKRSIGAVFPGIIGEVPYKTMKAKREALKRFDKLIDQYYGVVPEKKPKKVRARRDAMLPGRGMPKKRGSGITAGRFV